MQIHQLVSSSTILPLDNKIKQGFLFFFSYGSLCTQALFLLPRAYKHFLPRSPFFQVISAGCIVFLVMVTLLSLSILYLLNWQLQLCHTCQVPENTTFQKRSGKCGFRKTQANPKTSLCKDGLYLTRCTKTLADALQIPPFCNLCFFPEVECKCSILL